MEFQSPEIGKYTIYSKSGCKFCDKAKIYLSLIDKEYVEIPCDEYLLNRDAFLAFIRGKTNTAHRTFPMIFDSEGNFIGGYTELEKSIY
jgi:glutaredoxin